MSGAGTTGGAPARRAWQRAVLVCMVGAAAVAAGCAQIGTDPDVPASIEALPLPFPSIAIGDVLRDTLGVEQPLRAVLRNVRGDIIADAPVRWLYVQYARDSALEVDSVTGHIRALSLPTGTAQVAARYASSLQILLPIRVTNAPDTAFRADSAHLVGFVPDTGRLGADSNSVAVTVRLQYRNATNVLQNADHWLVRFTVVRPANLANDTTAAVFLMDDNRRPSQLDTTTAGLASRRVRVRPLQFPATGVDVDTVEVEAMVMRQGVPVPGAPIRILVPVSSPSTRGG